MVLPLVWAMSVGVRLSFWLPVITVSLPIVALVLGVPGNSQTGPGSDTWREASIGVGAGIYGLTALSMALGSVVYLAFHSLRATPLTSRRPRTSPNRVVRDIAALLPTTRWALLLTIGGIGVSVFVAARGAVVLLSRDSYQAHAVIPAIAPLAGFLLPIAFVAVYVSEPNTAAGRQIRRFLLAAVVLATYASGSRLLALFPIICLLERHGGSPNHPWARRAALLVLSALLLSLSLGLRHSYGGPGFGLIPYTLRIVHSPFTILSAGAEEAVRNVVFAVPLSAWVVQYGVESRHDLLVAANPLPGSLTSWNTISAALRVHFFIPYNTYGELARGGMQYLVGVSGIFGFLISIAEEIASRLAGVALRLSMVAVPALAYALSLEYNARSFFRLLWLLTLMTLVGAISARAHVGRAQLSARVEDP